MSNKWWLRALTFASWLAALRLLVMVGIAFFGGQILREQGIPEEVITEGRIEMFWDIPTAALLIFWPLLFYRK